MGFWKKQTHELQHPPAAEQPAARRQASEPPSNKRTATSQRLVNTPTNNNDVPTQRQPANTANQRTLASNQPASNTQRHMSNTQLQNHAGLQPANIQNVNQPANSQSVQRSANIQNAQIAQSVKVQNARSEQSPNPQHARSQQPPNASCRKSGNMHCQQPKDTQNDERPQFSQNSGIQSHMSQATPGRQVTSADNASTEPSTARAKDVGTQQASRKPITEAGIQRKAVTSSQSASNNPQSSIVAATSMAEGAQHITHPQLKGQANLASETQQQKLLKQRNLQQQQIQQQKIQQQKLQQQQQRLLQQKENMPQHPQQPNEQLQQLQKGQQQQLRHHHQMHTVRQQQQRHQQQTHKLQKQQQRQEQMQKLQQQHQLQRVQQPQFQQQELHQTEQPQSQKPQPLKPQPHQQTQHQKQQFQQPQEQRKIQQRQQLQQQRLQQEQQQQLVLKQQHQQLQKLQQQQRQGHHHSLQQHKAQQQQQHNLQQQKLQQQQLEQKPQETQTALSTGAAVASVQQNNPEERYDKHPRQQENTSKPTSAGSSLNVKQNSATVSIQPTGIDTTIVPIQGTALVQPAQEQKEKTLAQQSRETSTNSPVLMPSALDMERINSIPAHGIPTKAVVSKLSTDRPPAPARQDSTIINNPQESDITKTTQILLKSKQNIANVDSTQPDQQIIEDNIRSTTPVSVLSTRTSESTASQDNNDLLISGSVQGQEGTVSFSPVANQVPKHFLDSETASIIMSSIPTTDSFASAKRTNANGEGVCGNVVTLSLQPDGVKSSGSSASNLETNASAESSEITNLSDKTKEPLESSSNTKTVNIPYGDIHEGVASTGTQSETLSITPVTHTSMAVMPRSHTITFPVAKAGGGTQAPTISVAMSGSPQMISVAVSRAHGNIQTAPLLQENVASRPHSPQLSSVQPTVFRSFPETPSVVSTENNSVTVSTLRAAADLIRPNHVASTLVSASLQTANVVVLSPQTSTSISQTKETEQTMTKPFQTSAQISSKRPPQPIVSSHVATAQVNLPPATSVTLPKPLTNSASASSSPLLPRATSQIAVEQSVSFREPTNILSNPSTPTSQSVSTPSTSTITSSSRHPNNSAASVQTNSVSLHDSPMPHSSIHGASRQTSPVGPINNMAQNPSMKIVKASSQNSGMPQPPNKAPAVSTQTNIVRHLASAPAQANIVRHPASAPLQTNIVRHPASAPAQANTVRHPASLSAQTNTMRHHTSVSVNQSSSGSNSVVTTQANTPRGATAVLSHSGTSNTPTVAQSSTTGAAEVPTAAPQRLLVPQHLAAVSGTAQQNAGRNVSRTARGQPNRSSNHLMSPNYQTVAVAQSNSPRLQNVRHLANTLQQYHQQATPQQRSSTLQNASSQNSQRTIPRHQRILDPSDLQIDLLNIQSQNPDLPQVHTSGLAVGVITPRRNRHEALPDLLNSHIQHGGQQDHPPQTFRESQVRGGIPLGMPLPLDDEMCCTRTGCLCCLTAFTRFRWILIFLAILGVSCVVTGTVLGALHMTGNARYLTLSLLFIVLGVVLVVMVGIGWKCTPVGHEPCHMLLNLGSHCNRRTLATRPTHRGRNRSNWSGGVLYSEFRYRRPPPSYNTSMQDYQQQLMLAQMQISDANQSAPSSPPPSYKSRASSIRPGLHITFPTSRNHQSQPPTYRSTRNGDRSALPDLPSCSRNNSIQESTHRVLDYLQGILESHESQMNQANSELSQANAQMTQNNTHVNQVNSLMAEGVNPPNLANTQPQSSSNNNNQQSNHTAQQQNNQVNQTQSVQPERQLRQLNQHAQSSQQIQSSNTVQPTSTDQRLSDISDENENIADTPL